MILAVSPNQDAINKALGDFLKAVLPAPVEVVVGQINRVPPPKGQNYIVMWPIIRPRLGTNRDSSSDVLFVGSIAGDILTVSSVQFGTLAAGRTVFGVGILPDTVAVAQISGTPGGPGTYRVSKSQALSTRALAVGSSDLMQSTKVTMQIDVHGPSASDNVQIITTTFRDDFGVQFFAAESGGAISPLYTEDPRQMPFSDGEHQNEDRWVIGAHLQADQSVVIPQQFADAVAIGIVNVEATYPTS